jgi:hypothetical protein
MIHKGDTKYSRYCLNLSDRHVLEITHKRPCCFDEHRCDMVGTNRECPECEVNEDVGYMLFRVRR